MGSAFVRGLQGDDPNYLKAAACAKHYAVHSGPEKLRHSFNAQVSRRDLYATYLPAFKKLVTEARVEAVMGAYNRMLGEPCCASQLLLQDILRGEWGFAGHVVSDCWALSDIHGGHHITKSPVETAALALKAGCDISCGCTYDHLGEALEQGLISVADIDLALSRTLATRFKLGMFDPQEQVPYAATPMSVVGSKKHRDLAYRAALQSAVLLKNKDRSPDQAEGEEHFCHRPGRRQPGCAAGKLLRYERPDDHPARRYRRTPARRYQARIPPRLPVDSGKPRPTQLGRNGSPRLRPDHCLRRDFSADGG